MKQASQTEGAQAPQGCSRLLDALALGLCWPVPSDDSLAFQTEFRTRERVPTVNVVRECGSPAHWMAASSP